VALLVVNVIGNANVLITPKKFSISLWMAFRLFPIFSMNSVKKHPNPNHKMNNLFFRIAQFKAQCCEKRNRNF
jgi:hypothetical protein